MQTPNKTPYFLAVAFWIVSFCLTIISYGTGYWFVAEGEGRLFTRLGLWEACFEGYEHTSDYIGKAYYGCWWIFHQEYSYIRQWIMPSWFIAVQTLMTFAVVFAFIGLVVVPMAGTFYDTILRQKMAVFVTLMSTLCIGISLVVFGTEIGEDRTWMPRPDENVLGWSFGLAVIAGFMSCFSCISITTYMLMCKYYLDRDTYDTATTKKMMPMVPKV